MTTPFRIPAFCSSLFLNLLWPRDSIFDKQNVAEVTLCRFWGEVRRRLASPTLHLLEYLLFRHCSLSESSRGAVRSPSLMKRPWVGALVRRPRWEPASNGNHVNVPSWTSSPAKPSCDFTSSCHLTATVWLRQNRLAEPGQSTETWVTKINVCGKPSSFEIVGSTETGNWNTLIVLYSSLHVTLPFTVVITAVTMCFLPDYLIHDAPK